MASGGRHVPEGEKITVRESDGYLVATDETTGVASQGDTKAEALANLAEAIELYEQPADPGDEEELEPSSAPWF